MKMKSFVLIDATLTLIAATLLSCTTAILPDLYGNLAPPATAVRTVVIAPDTRLVNVKDYETVKFLVGDKSFAWRFDPAPRLDQLYLNWIAPPNVLDHPVWIIVTTDPAKTDR
jgi:hypothetical protein